MVISIHALREESDPHHDADQTVGQIISIHALREESDPTRPRPLHVLPISIHALREESDYRSLISQWSLCRFQSTLSVRRATVQLDIFVRFLRRKPAA